MKRTISLLLAVLMTVCFAGCSSGISAEEYNAVVSERDGLKAEVADLQAQVDSYEKEIEPYRNLSEAELLQKTEEANLKAEQDRQEKERLQAEEEEKKQQEEAAASAAAAAEEEAKRQKTKEEIRGLAQNVSYEEVARYPADYEGKPIKLAGSVVQVVDGSGQMTLRVAQNNDYDRIFLVNYYYDSGAPRVLEDDRVTIYGTCTGVTTYTTTMGADLTIPSMITSDLTIN